LGFKQDLIQGATEYLMFWNHGSTNVPCLEYKGVIQSTGYWIFQITRCSEIEDAPKYRMFQNIGCSRIHDFLEYRMFQNTGCSRIQDVPE